MNQIPIYQHPFVDVFKAVKLTEWQLGAKEGDVTEVYDKALAKNVIKISGVTPTSNYIQLPAQKHLPKKALGLIGKYVYSIVQVPAGKTFVIHFDYIVNDTRLVRLSLSNIYKEFKNLNGASIQVPVNDGLPFNKWTVICINAHQILHENQCFASGQKESFFMRSMQVTANVMLRGIYTSDIKYTVQTLPKDMQLKILKGQDWFSLYSWIEYPQTEGGVSIATHNEAQENAAALKENISGNTQHTGASAKGARIKSKKSGSGFDKQVKFSDASAPVNTMEQEEEKQALPMLSLETQQEMLQKQCEMNKETIERTLKDIEVIKDQYNLNLEEKHLQPSADVTFFYDQDKTVFPKPIGKVQRALKDDEIFVLKPNPIMKLDRVIGINPRYTSGQVFFNKDAKLSREILYTSANMLLGYQHASQKQRLFFDHPTASIEHFHIDGNYAFTATRTLIEGSAEGQSKDFELSIWDVQDAKLAFSFKPPIQTLHSITLNEQSHDQYFLCVAGKDFQRRDVILIYNFQSILQENRVDIYARQLCDFDMVHIRFSDASNTALVACGRENIRLFKIKNGHLPGQSVTLNNTGRGKIFNQSLVDFAVSDKGAKKPTNVFVTTNCGLLYIVNYHTRQVDKIIQIHEEKITSILMAPKRNFIATASINGLLRLWSPDFSKLISEVNTHQEILSCDINHKEIVVMGAVGTISILDMEESTFNVIMRSHLDNLTDLAFNKPGGKVVTIGLDQKIYIWNSETMEVVTEFATQNDIAIKLSTSLKDPTVAVGFKSGFIRIFDLSYETSGKLLAETMIFESPVMDLQYSSDNKFLAVFYKSCRIVIFNVEKGYQPVKNIDYEFPNDNYFSVSFSYDDRYMANISSNANNVTIWETRNFSLKFHLDLTGEVISKVAFAPNGKDLVILTTNSKLKFYRITYSELLFNKEIYGVTDLECLDFAISPNCKFIACCGKEGVVKIYDYFMRGSAVPSSQAVIGHYRYPKKAYWTDEMRSLFTLGDGNGIFKWSFFGDKDQPSDMSKHYEELEVKAAQKALQPHSDEPIFNHDPLLQTANTHIDEQLDRMSKHFNGLQTRDQDPLTTLNNPTGQQQNLLTLGQGTSQSTLPLMPMGSATVQYNAQGYRFEQYDIELKKVLQCSIGNEVKNNLVWNKEMRYIAYTSHNIVIVEDLNQEKSQRLLKEGNDRIYQLKLSPNGKLLLGFTREGKIDGFPCIFVWDSATLKKLNTIAINDAVLTSVEFSVHSNMLLVVSSSPNNSSENADGVITCISVWDFLDGHRDILCKSHLPMQVNDVRWNFYLGDSNEFVTVSDKKYHYWKISGNLTLQYMEGDITKQQKLLPSDSFTTCEFVVPTPEQLSVYLMLGLNNGYVWVVDSRCNQFIYNVKVIDSAVRMIYTSKSRIIIEGASDPVIRCWHQGQGDCDSSDPRSFFLSKERILTLDGFPNATGYEEACGECIVSTSSGTLWLASWVENATIKLKSCHSPHCPIGTVDFKYLPPGQFQLQQQEENEAFHQFDQNYAIASSGKDGVIKLWNMFDSEFLLQFIVPKEECVAIAMHQFKPYMVASFTDGFLRFFEINKSKTLGRVQLHHQDGSGEGMVDYLIAVKILPSGNHILGASKNGQVILIYIQQWDPLAVKVEQLASINTTLNNFDVSFLEPYNKWLVGTANGKVIVYNRKDFNAYQQEIFDEQTPPRFNFMDSFNLLDYVDNQFTESKRCSTLDHYYSTAKRNLVKNDVDPQHRCEGLFSNADLTLHISFIVKCPYLFIRNFELHQVVRRIALQSLPVSLSITPHSSFFIVLQADNFLKMVDFVNPENTSEILTIHEEARVMRLCPNGRYVLTGGDKGDICIWAIKRRDTIPLPVEVLQIE